MKEEREKLYQSRMKIQKAIDLLLEQTHPPKDKLENLQHEFTIMTNQLRKFDNMEFTESPPASSSNNKEDPYTLFCQIIDHLVTLSQSKDRLQDLFFGRPRKARMAQFFHESKLEAAKILKQNPPKEMQLFLIDWIAEVEKTKNPDLYNRKIEVYSHRFQKIYARIPAPGVGGG